MEDVANSAQQTAHRLGDGHYWPTIVKSERNMKELKSKMEDGLVFCFATARRDKLRQLLENQTSQ